MTKSLDETNRSSPSDAKILRDVREVGWHVTGVFAQENEEGPDWAFSIGLFHSFQHSEVIIFGLRLERCMDVVNVIGTEVQRGNRYAAGRKYSDILQDPYQCIFREVNQRHYRDHVGYALWFYEADPFPLLQCFWPDKCGQYPWDAGCNGDVKSAQPLLFQP